MAVLRSQPRGKVRFRPQYQGRAVGAIFNNSRLEVDSAAEVKLFNNPSLVQTPNGWGRKFEIANSSYATISPLPGIVDFSLTQPFAIVCILTPYTLGVATRILSYRHEASVTGIQLGYTTSNRLGYWFGSSSGSAAVRGAGVSTVLKAGESCVVVFGWDNGHFMYIDGVAQGAQSIATFVTSNSGANTDINIGRRNTGSSYFDGGVSLFAHIRGSVDAMSLSLNPWQLFEEEEDDDFLAVVEAQLRRALYLNGQGYILERPSGNSAKPMVLQNGVLKERSASEGVPVILEDGKLRTLATGETLIL